MKRKLSSSSISHRLRSDLERPSGHPAKSSEDKLRPFYWIRRRSGAIIYRDVPSEHIASIVQEFAKVLSKHYKNHTLTTTAYRPQDSDTGKSDVQCHFGNKVANGTNVLAQRADTKRNPFELHVCGNHYAPVLVNNCVKSNWRLIDTLYNHSDNADPCPGGVKELVLRHLQSPVDENTHAFSVIMQSLPLLLGPCRTRSVASPCIIPYQDCWRKTLTEDQLLQMLLSRVGEGSAYRSDNAHHPAEREEPFHAIALRQVLGGKKDDEPPHCIFNIPLEEESSMQIPLSLHGNLKTMSNNSAIVSANIAAKGYVVDLHIDHGMSGLSTVFHDCVKFWVLYPPNEVNLDAFYKLHSQEQKLSRLVRSLRDGISAITTRGDTMYIPAGWLHATMTVRAGSLLGTNWIYGFNLPIVADIFAREFDTDSVEASWRPLLETFLLSITTSTDMNDELRILCPLWSRLGQALKKEKNASFLSKEYREQSKRLKGIETCPGCNLPIASHKVLKELLLR